MGGSSPAQPQGVPFRVVALLAIAVFINYVDRGSLATAGPLLKGELGLSNFQFGLLGSAFFISYAPLQPVAGWLAQRFDVRYVLAAGLVIWALATALVGLATSFAMLFALRLLLGVGESVTYPSNSKLLGQRCPEHQRGRANGVIAACQALGPTFGTLVGGLIMVRFGWRAAFIGFGLASLFWLLPWFLVTRGGTATYGGEHGAPLPYLALLKQRALWGSSIGQFFSTYSYYFVLTWLPLILVKSYGYSVKEMAQIGAGVYAIHAASSALIGWASDRWILAGASVNHVRKTLLVSGLIGIAAVMMMCASAVSTAAVVLLAVAAALHGTQTPNIFAISQTLGGPRAAGQWMGVQNLVGNLAGVTAPALTGFVVDRTGEYYWAFAIAAGAALLGSLAYGVVIPRIEPVEWQVDRTRAGKSGSP
ncbi:MAG TPA: MFS transporter [Steroidobacteraceae bacterium]